MNGATFTIKRDILKNSDGVVNVKSAMYIYWGELDESLNPPKDNHWQKFEYNTGKKKSFSNVIFENINVPIVKGDNNITIHQLLRLLYIDQESPTSSLFYYEQFDSQITRETVSDLLLGVYNQELYEKKKRLIHATKEFDGIKSELKATKQFFSDLLTLNPNHIRTTIDNKRKEIYEIEEKIISIRNNKEEVIYDEDSKLEFQYLAEQSITQRNTVNELKEAIKRLEYEIEDSEYFIENLREKIKALKNSILTRDFLGNFPLEYCPECLTKITPTDKSNTCQLCKEEKDDSYGIIQARKMEQEISFQINESISLLELNKREYTELTSKLDAELIKLQQLQIRVNSAMKDVKSFDNEILDKLYTDKGFIEGEILQYQSMLENAELYQKLLTQKNELEKEIRYLKGYIYKTEASHQKLKSQINLQIKKEGVYLLNNDLERQDEFKNANEFYIDYTNNISFLSNKFSKYSASSNFYLKISARFAIFLASLSIDRMRYPRFIFADNMEDKGIELLRAQNLQKILIERVEKFSSDTYQMIYTTSYITDELDNSGYCVGEYYSKSNPSLKNIVK